MNSVKIVDKIISRKCFNELQMTHCEPENFRWSLVFWHASLNPKDPKWVPMSTNGHYIIVYWASVEDELYDLTTTLYESTSTFYFRTVQPAFLSHLVIYFVSMVDSRLIFNTLLYIYFFIIYNILTLNVIQKNKINQKKNWIKKLSAIIFINNLLRIWHLLIICKII